MATTAPGTGAGPAPLPLPLRSVCVFLGSADGTGDAYRAAATATGSLLASQGLAVVYGSAGIGCMGALADGALAAGGRVIGVLPMMLGDREIGHRYDQCISRSLNTGRSAAQLIRPTTHASPPAHRVQRPDCAARGGHDARAQDQDG